MKEFKLAVRQFAIDDKIELKLLTHTKKDLLGVVKQKDTHGILSSRNNFGNTIMILTCLICSCMFSVSLCVLDKQFNLVIYFRS